MFGIQSNMPSDHARNLGEGIENISLTDSNEIINVSIDDINQLHVIINDNDCGNAFFSNVLNVLKAYDLDFTISNQNNNLAYEDATIITLDQKLSYSNKTLLIGPYKDASGTNSEALLKATQVTFSNQGWEVITLSGILKYAESSDSDIVYTKVASPTEENTFKTNAQITIALGTESYTPDKLAYDILLSLARYQYYLTHNNNFTDEENDVIARQLNNDNTYLFSDKINKDNSFDPNLNFQLQQVKSHSK